MEFGDSDPRPIGVSNVLMCMYITYTYGVLYLAEETESLRVLELALVLMKKEGEGWLRVVGNHQDIDGYKHTRLASWRIVTAGRRRQNPLHYLW